MTKSYTEADVRECDSVEELAMLIGDDALETLKYAVIKTEKDRQYRKDNYVKRHDRDVAIRAELKRRGIDIEALLRDTAKA